ncbi:hypothetical protein PVAP13_8KG388790 [Panicum virgatum]|uniref:Uncharacterized protein n=1 Tax=Panicum virgatum TaxID=38727 RepID=A0A8T0PUZ9_PANVG|nr:hypothetical protein PVAP13_8KG388790 [Panicum virgatum]
MAAHKFHSTTTFKAVVVLAIAALLLASTGYAAEATRPADNGFDAPPPCTKSLGEGETCGDWCRNLGYSEGSFANTVCCCGSRLRPPQAAA